MTNEFIPVISAASLLPGQGRLVHVHGQEVAVFNCDGEFFALDNSCPHKGCPLSAGLVKDGQLFCPFHGWEFEVRSGRCVNRPDRPARAFCARVRDGQVEICLDHKAPLQPEDSV